MAPSRSTAMVLAGIALLLVTLGGSAALAAGGPEQPPADGDNQTRSTLIGSQGGGPGWHKFGSVYLVNGTEVAWREGSADSYFDATRLENGTVVAGFMDEGYQECGRFESPCTHSGYRIIDPDAEGGPKVVSEWSFPVRTGLNSEVHDVEPLPGGGFVMTDMEYERILIVKNGEVTWQWNASNFYEAPPDPTTVDWLHINDVDRIGDGRFLVSVRNANQLLVVERGQGVVQVINEDTKQSDDDNCVKDNKRLVDRDGDGDFKCGDPSVLNHQHNPQWLGDGAVLVADSDNDRIVELHKGDNGEWKVAWEMHSAGGQSLRWPRDADRLQNGNTLITDTQNKRIVEVNRTGEVVWSYSTQRIPYEADRLPEGERVGGVSYGSGQVGQAGKIPVLSVLVTGVRGAAPWVPAWYAEPQVALTLVSLALVIAGAVVGVKERL